MSSACNCIAGASKTLRAAPALRLPVQFSARRTFASTHTSKPATSLRIAATNNTSCSSKANLYAGRRTNGMQEQMRSFSSSMPRHKLKTIEQVRARNKGGPFNLAAALLFIATAGGLYIYFTQEKERMARKRVADQTKGVGKPKVGGPFALVDHHGKKFTSEDLLGKYTLVCWLRCIRLAMSRSSEHLACDWNSIGNTRSAFRRNLLTESRSTSASLTALTSAPTSSTKWP